jgi:Zn-dependent alcohol dehydrogenase
MILSCKLTNKTKAKVAEKVRCGKCLQCEEKSVKRGLCQKHYDRWHYKRTPLSKTARIKYDRDLIISGDLLEAYGASQYKQLDVFSRRAREAS